MKRETGEMKDLKAFMHMTICELIFSIVPITEVI